MNKFQFFFLIILIKSFFSQDKIYKKKFGLFNNKKSESDTSMVNILNNRLYLNLSIGTPSQIIPFELDSTCQTFSVSNFYFNKNISSTFEQFNKNPIYFAYELIEIGYNSKDVINIDNSIHNNLYFILGERYPSKKRNQLGIVGLHIPEHKMEGVFHFLASLKEAGIINSYTWTLKFFDNISLSDLVNFKRDKDNLLGELIIGDEPSNYENDKFIYNETEFHKITPSSKNGNTNWELEFNNIYLSFPENQNNSIITYQGNKVVEIVINFSYILCPKLFLDFLKEQFFSQYITDKVCSAKILDYSYSYIECENNSTFKVESFPNICFEHAGFETTFNLTYKDLFIEDKKNNKYIFLIYAKDYSNNWVIGTPFLRKYQFVFNNDLKFIGYYRQIYHNEGNSDDESLRELNKSKKVKTVVVVILIIIFSLLLIFIGMTIQRKYFNKNRKIRANELEENFSYESSNNKEVNNDNKIIKEDNEKIAYYNL